MANEYLLYTVIFGGYDKLKEIPPQARDPRFDYICLTDDSSLKSDTYKIHVIDANDSPLRLARRYKILQHDTFSDYQATVYIDGKIGLEKSLFPLLDGLKDWDLIGFAHYKRSCLYQEAAVLLHPYKQLETIANIVPLISRFRTQGFPKMFGLLDSSILVRKNTRALRLVMGEWHRLVQQYSRRDQLSLMYELWKSGIPFGTIPHSTRSQFATQHEHLARRSADNYWDLANTPWLECFDPYEHETYFFNHQTRQCKWRITDVKTEEHYKFLEKGKTI